MSKSPEQLAAWRDGYLYGKRDGSEGRPQAPRGDAEGYELGYRWGVRHQAEWFACVCGSEFRSEFDRDEHAGRRGCLLVITSGR